MPYLIIALLALLCLFVLASAVREVWLALKEFARETRRPE